MRSFDWRFLRLQWRVLNVTRQAHLDREYRLNGAHTIAVIANKWEVLHTLSIAIFTFDFSSF